MDTPPMRLLSADEYWNTLLTSIAGARRRVILHAMDIRWGERIDALVPVLLEAAARGTEVRLVGDMYSKFQAYAPRLHRGKAIKNWRQIQAVNERLRGHGVHVTYVGKVGLNPYKHRTHSKINIVDDRIFTFGGINFTDDLFVQKDYMLDMHDPILADRLYRLVRAIEKDEEPTLSDIEEHIGGSATLLFDGGTPKQSVIYDTACEVVKAAQKVYYVSQMCPSGRLARALTARDSECYFTRPGQVDPPSNWAMLLDQTQFKIQNRYRGAGYIHAKFILTEDKSGRKHLISGSNNFSWRGIAYGTKEIAVHATDEALWQQFYTFLQTVIKQQS